jgi:hypothetical protein
MVQSFAIHSIRGGGEGEESPLLDKNVKKKKKFNLIFLISEIFVIIGAIGLSVILFIERLSPETPHGAFEIPYHSCAFVVIISILCLTISTSGQRLPLICSLLGFICGIASVRMWIQGTSLWERGLVDEIRFGGRVIGALILSFVSLILANLAITFSNLNKLIKSLLTIGISAGHGFAFTCNRRIKFEIFLSLFVVSATFTALAYIPARIMVYRSNRKEETEYRDSGTEINTDI